MISILWFFSLSLFLVCSYLRDNRLFLFTNFIRLNVIDGCLLIYFQIFSYFNSNCTTSFHRSRAIYVSIYPGSKQIKKITKCFWPLSVCMTSSENWMIALNFSSRTYLLHIHAHTFTCAAMACGICITFQVVLCK